ncbi:MAG: hypothetical protein P0Y55_03180 [Candidatus Cohnella colombiensis]|uniref:Uncharacterized protein n=1 Tax=Candidatus Cohnella colombiensis TaxID=3121368 RepID=A0AA95EYG6_9BACL|nr:MAG: hypothetical protein P0Y55_03180 [Cohnella sp.]
MNNNQSAHNTRGGMIWLTTLIIVACEWGAAISSWNTLLLSWATCMIAVLYTKRVRGIVNRSQLLRELLFVAIMWIVVVLIGFEVTKIATTFVESTQHPFWQAFLISLLLTIGVIAWLLSAIIVGMTYEATKAAQLLRQAWTKLRTAPQLWSVALVTLSMQMIAVHIGNNGSVLLQIVFGCVAGYTQLWMLGRLTPPLKIKQTITASTTRRRLSPSFLGRIAIVSIFAVSLLFYILLGMYTDDAILREMLLFILSCAVLALIAWLIGYVKPLYIAVFILIVLINIIFLGIIVGVYGSLIVK